MRTAGTQPSRVKRIPHCAAASEEVFRMAAGAATPKTRSRRLPAAQGATDASEFILLYLQLRKFLGNLLSGYTLLEEQEHDCRQAELMGRFSTHQHFNVSESLPE